MSEESKTTEKITSVEKVKDPRRVEAGKRLGMISKQAKERKALREREQSAVKAKEKNDDWFPNALVSSPVVGIGFVGLVGLALYFGYNGVALFEYVKKYKSKGDGLSHVKSLTSDTKDGSGTQNSNPENEVKPKRVYKELDTLD